LEALLLLLLLLLLLESGGGGGSGGIRRWILLRQVELRRVGLRVAVARASAASPALIIVVGHG